MYTYMHSLFDLIYVKMYIPNNNIPLLNYNMSQQPYKVGNYHQLQMHRWGR